MKITIGQIVTVIIILGLIYNSVFGLIIPLINDTASESLNEPSEIFGVITTFLIGSVIFLYFIYFLKENWDRGFNINLKFNKNKE